jgi:hypothetical protein
VAQAVEVEARGGGLEVVSGHELPTTRATEKGMGVTSFLVYEFYFVSL